MKRNSRKRSTVVTPGSENVFADLRLPRADEALTKARIAHELCELIRRDGLNQVEAARRLGVDQPKVSALMRGRLQGFSTDRLLRFLNALGQDVDIVIHPTRSRRRGAQIQVVMAA